MKRRLSRGLQSEGQNPGQQACWATLYHRATPPSLELRLTQEHPSHRPIVRGGDGFVRVRASTAPTSVLTQRWRVPAYLLYSVSVVCAQLASWGLAAGEVNSYFCVSMSSLIKDSRGCLQSFPAPLCSLLSLWRSLYHQCA